MSRFETVTDEELRTILDGKNAEQTKNQTKSQWHAFETYLRQKNLNISVKSVSKEELDSILCKK